MGEIVTRARRARTWYQSALVTVWHRVTFKRTREALLAVMTNQEDNKVPGRFWWCVGCVSYTVFQGAAILKGQAFDPMAYAGGIGVINALSAGGVWLSAKSKET